jgi:hypothetical protein
MSLYSVLDESGRLREGEQRGINDTRFALFL